MTARGEISTLRGHCMHESESRYIFADIWKADQKWEMLELFDRRRPGVDHSTV